MATEMRWNKNWGCLSSPMTSEIRRPTSYRWEAADSLIGCGWVCSTKLAKPLLQLWGNRCHATETAIATHHSSAYSGGRTTSAKVLRSGGRNSRVHSRNSRQWQSVPAGHARLLMTTLLHQQEPVSDAPPSAVIVVIVVVTIIIIFVMWHTRRSPHPSLQCVITHWTLG